MAAAGEQAHRTLSSRAAESEAKLSYTALGDLLEGVLEDALHELPDPQRRALDTALLRAETEGSPPDQRAVSIALVGVLRALSSSGPLIIAIDDVQWIDAPSARVLSFAIRRRPGAGHLRSAGGTALVCESCSRVGPCGPRGKGNRSFRAHAHRATDRTPCRGRQNQSGSRGRALREREDRGGESHADLPQAGHPVTRRADPGHGRNPGSRRRVAIRSSGTSHLALAER